MKHPSLPQPLCSRTPVALMWHLRPSEQVKVLVTQSRHPAQTATPRTVALTVVPLSVGLAAGNNLLENERNFPSSLWPLGSCFPHPVSLKSLRME